MYAIDRYASFKQDWEKKYIDDYIIITDRYVTSNMIHQASKIEDIKEKDEYLRWLIDLEYNKNEIPEPDIVIFLKMPIDKAKELMENRKNKIDGSEKRDIHEVNEDYLKKSYENATAISKNSSRAISPSAATALPMSVRMCCRSCHSIRLILQDSMSFLD